MALEQIIRFDPAGRGVPGFRHADRWLGQGELLRAAQELARGFAAGTPHVALVTGFCVIDGDTVTAETDGPPGTLFLARAIEQLGGRVTLISDRYGLPLLAAGCRRWNTTQWPLVEFPAAGDETWCDEFLAQNADLTHLVSIERVGPSHTGESVVAQRREVAAPLEQFEALVPVEHRDRCHNMRGVDIGPYSPPAYRLFERLPEVAPKLKTLGVVDGGNEIGMGNVPWEVLCQAIATGPAPRVACRIPVDYLVVAGTCNWGAYALACGLARLRQRAELINAWTAADQRAVIEAMVVDADGRDGITRRRESTVDTIAMPEYCRVLEAIRGWAPSTG